MNLFVGNVDYNVSEDQLQGIFAEYGDLDSVKIITDRQTGRSKGFAFVEMPNDDQAQKAIESLNGYELNRREISVSEARPREENSGGGRNGGGGYGNRDNRRY